MNYREISKQLIEELAAAVMNGQSIALLAARFGGKRYVLHRVREACERGGLTPLLQVQFLDEQDAVYTEAGLAGQLRRALRQSGVETAGDADPFDAIEQFAAQTGKRVTLFVANVDAIAQGLTRRLLKRFRKLVEARQLTVVLTGESDFQELVHGPNSEFTGSENYFLQGFTEAEFGRFLDRYVHSLGVELVDREAIVHFLWQRTGGSSYLVRPLITEVLEKKVKLGERLNSRPLTIDDYRAMPRAKAIPGTYSTHLCRHATKMIAWEPECWADLARLLKGETVAAGLAPTPLEWAGVAVRAGVGEQRQLRFASAMMENYARLHYNPLHFGDLYLRNGLWSKAMECYAQVPAALKRRPLNADDRTETEKNMNAFGNALLSAAMQGVEEVKHVFAQGCQHLLGFGEVTFWRHEDKWVQRPVHDIKAPLSPALQARVKEILAEPGTPNERFFTLPDGLAEYAMTVKVTPFNSAYLGAVIVSDLAEGVVISRERRRLLKAALLQFAQAYEHAATVWRTSHWLKVREQQMELINSVFRAMGGQLLDVDSVLMRVAVGLAEMGYRRVLFCLVDPQRRRIQGVLDYTRELRRMDVAKMTNYPIPPPNRATSLEEFEDIQPYVIYTRQPFVTADSGKELLTNKAVVAATGMTGLAIVPILNHRGEAIGTIHVERDDKLKPSQEEVDVLLDFGRLIATAIAQAERVNLLQTTLDNIPEPVAIVDSLEQFRYANRPAAAALSVSSGWQERSEDGIPLKNAPTLIRQAVQRALAGERTFQHVRETAGQREDPAAILSDCIRNKKKGVLGAFLHMQELTDFYKVFDAFTQLAVRANTDEAVDAMLEAAKLLGYQQGRLYVIDPETGALKSKHCYGMPEPEARAAFERGEVVWPRAEEDGQSWVSLKQQTPVVFCFNPELPSGTRRRTALGLEYIVYNEQHAQLKLQKRPGDFWVDVPLLTKKGPLGKLILPCDEYLKPESFELLKALSDKVDAGVFDSYLERSLAQQRQAFEIQAAAVKRAAEKVTADVAHNLATRFGSFPGYLELYRYYEQGQPELKRVNDSFEHALTQAQGIVKRAKEMLAPVSQTQLRFERLRMPDFLERFFQAALPSSIWQVDCLGQIELEADAHRLEAALAELLQNSKDAQAGQGHLAVSVQIELSKHEQTPQVRLVYSDNGPGIPAELRARIFEDFFSFHPERSRGNNGLGMGFVERVVRAHGGRIELGVPPRGAEFIITLPQWRGAPLENKEAYVSHAAG